MPTPIGCGRLALSRRPRDTAKSAVRLPANLRILLDDGIQFLVAKHHIALVERHAG
jgi:hypothetical protein